MKNIKCDPGEFVFFFVDYETEGVRLVSWRNDGQKLPRGAVVIARDNNPPEWRECPVTLRAYEDLKRSITAGGIWESYHPTVAINLITSYQPIKNNDGLLVVLDPHLA